MKLYVMDAFANRIFGGNQAGVALPDRELSDETMRQIAAEMKHSETAFIHMEPDGSVSLRYFTPAGEVDLCGHATVASFALLRQLEKIGDGDHIAHTKAGELNITVRGGLDGYGAAAADRRHPGSGARRAVRRLWPDGGGLPGGIYPTNGVHRSGGYYDARPGP